VALAEKKALLAGVQEKVPAAEDEVAEEEEKKQAAAAAAASSTKNARLGGLDTSIDDLPPVVFRPVDPNILFKGRPMYLTVRE